MKDTISTILGFCLGAILLIFGIIFPDKYSNYYVFQITSYDQQIQQMQKDGQSLKRIEAVKEEVEIFKDSVLGSVSRFLDLKSFGIVAGGAFAALLIAFPFSKAIKVFAFVIQALGKDKIQEDFLSVYETVIKFAEKRSQGTIITDEEVAQIENENLMEWVQDFVIVDVVSEEMITEIIESEIEMYNYRAFEEIDVLKFLGSATPAFGMVGTVVGLILMLGSAAGEGTGIADVMGAMSVALITTLYGVLAAQLIFIPVATKRYQLKESNNKLLEMIQEGILYLRRRELVEAVSQDLIIYLPKKLRKHVLEEKISAMAAGDLGL